MSTGSKGSLLNVMQTYYVTLDLSKPDFIARQQRTVLNGRGGYKEKALGNKVRGKDDEDDAERQDREDLDEEEVQQQQQQQQQQNGKGANDKVEEVQILELHSENPIISYKGRIYVGQWSQNVGTELLMVKQDDKNPLPALRSLGDGVDLLAASSARIITTEKEIKPRHPGAQHTKAGAFSSNRDKRYDPSDIDPDEAGGPVSIVPRPEVGSSQGRFDQGQFLAKLVAIKKEKGETDEVTIVAESHQAVARRTANEQEGDGTKRKTWKRRVPVGVSRGRPLGRPRGRTRGRGNRQNDGLLAALNRESPTDDTGVPPDDMSSRPTPAGWSEIQDDGDGVVDQRGPADEGNDMDDGKYEDANMDGDDMIVDD
jgi:hypothetical protein